VLRIKNYTYLVEVVEGLHAVKKVKENGKLLFIQREVY
jgi:hypothetical protein